MEYPQDILPKIGFKKIDQSSDLSRFLLMRGTPDENIIDESTDQIKNNYLEEEGQEKRFLTWSCNLYNLFKTDYVKYKVHNSELTHKEWDYISEVKIPVKSDDYTILPNFGCYFLKITDILTDLKVPYNREKEINAHAKPYIEHVPTPCNFWHFEIKWMDAKNVAISKNMGATWKNTLVATMRAYIRNYCKTFDDIRGNTIPILEDQIFDTN